MTGLLAIVIGVLFIGVIVVLFMREVSLYRKDQRDPTEIVRYSRKRLYFRMGISSCLAFEVFLLFLLPSILRRFGSHILKGSASGWFVVYVSMVLALAMGLAVLAFLDLKESTAQLKKGERQLLSELIQEVKRGKEPPELH